MAAAIAWAPILLVLVGVPTAVAVFAAAWAFWRGGGGTALATLETANRILEGRVHDLEEQVRASEKLIAQLERETNIAKALQPLVDWTQKHEKADEMRFAQTLAVLDLIAHRMGPDLSLEGGAA